MLGIKSHPRITIKDLSLSLSLVLLGHKCKQTRQQNLCHEKHFKVILIKVSLSQSFQRERERESPKKTNKQSVWREFSWCHVSSIQTTVGLLHYSQFGYHYDDDFTLSLTQQESGNRGWDRSDWNREEAERETTQAQKQEGRQQRNFLSVSPKRES